MLSKVDTLLVKSCLTSLSLVGSHNPLSQRRFCIFHLHNISYSLLLLSRQ